MKQHLKNLVDFLNPFKLKKNVPVNKVALTQGSKYINAVLQEHNPSHQALWNDKDIQSW